MKGLPNPAECQRATDLFLKTQWLLERGGGIVFATGTPIANTIAESCALPGTAVGHWYRSRGAATTSRSADRIGHHWRLGGKHAPPDVRIATRKAAKQFASHLAGLAAPAAARPAAGLGGTSPPQGELRS